MIQTVGYKYEISLIMVLLTLKTVIFMVAFYFQHGIKRC